jgi:hypothetical protein
VDLYIHSPIRLHAVVLNYLSTGTALPFILSSHLCHIYILFNILQASFHRKNIYVTYGKLDLVVFTVRQVKCNRTE